MSHEEILQPHLSTINYLGLRLEVIDRDSALKAMAEAVANNSWEWIQKLNATQEQLSAKDKEIEKWEGNLKNLKHRINEHYGGGFTDEDIALAHYKSRCEEQDKEIAELKLEIKKANDEYDWQYDIRKTQEAQIKILNMDIDTLKSKISKP